MASLQREGKVRFIGIASCTGSKLDQLQTTAPVTSVSVPYSLLRRELEQCLRPPSTSHNVGIIACSTLASGLLTGTMTPDRALPYNDWRRRHELEDAAGFRHRLVVVVNLRGEETRLIDR